MLISVILDLIQVVLSCQVILFQLYFGYKRGRGGQRRLMEGRKRKERRYIFISFGFKVEKGRLLNIVRSIRIEIERGKGREERGR